MTDNAFFTVRVYRGKGRRLVRTAEALGRLHDVLRDAERLAYWLGGSHATVRPYGASRAHMRTVRAGPGAEAKPADGATTAAWLGSA